MKNDQFAVYRVDRNSEGRDLWHLSYQEAVSRKLAIRIEYYRQIDLRPLLPGESAIALWKRMKESCEMPCINRIRNMVFFFPCINHF